MMKRHFLIVFGLLCLLCLDLQAQIPQGISYQAIARDQVGNVIANQPVNIRLSVVQNDRVIYSETHPAATNGLGLFNITLGSGTASKGKFSAIPWEKGKTWLRTELQTSAGAPFRLAGEMELLSVPYALHAASAQKLAGDGHQRALADSVWLLEGNSGTSAAINYIGTNDFEDLVFKTDTTERMRIKAQGLIGIGTVSPSTDLEIVGSFRAGDGSNYAQVTGSGDLFFKAGGDYLVGPNRYAFRYMLDEDYGLKFNATNSRYEFATTGGGRIFSVHANTGNTYVSGRLGVKTATPAAQLHVMGDAWIGDTADYAQFSTSGDLFFRGNADYLVGSDRYAFRYSVNPNFGIFFNATGSQYEFLDASANPVFGVGANSGNGFFSGTLGVGVSNPAEQLEVAGAIKVGNTTNANAGAIRWTGADFEGYDGSVWKSLTKDDDNQTLSISGDTLSITGGNSVILPSGGSGGQPAWYLSGNNATGSDFLGTTNNTDLKIATNGTLRAIFKRGGPVGIGTSSPAYDFHVEGTTKIEGDFINQDLKGTHNNTTQNIAYNANTTVLNNTTQNITILDGNGVDNSGVLIMANVDVYVSQFFDWAGDQGWAGYIVTLQRAENAAFTNNLTTLTSSSAIVGQKYTDKNDGFGSTGTTTYQNGLAGNANISYADLNLQIGRTYYYRLVFDVTNTDPPTAGSYLVGDRSLNIIQVKR